MPPKLILKTLTIALACLSIFISIHTPFHLMQEHHWKPATETGLCNQDCSDNTHRQNRIECNWFTPKISNFNFLINSNPWNFIPENSMLLTITGPYQKPLVICLNISRAPPSFL